MLVLALRKGHILHVGEIQLRTVGVKTAKDRYLTLASGEASENMMQREEWIDIGDVGMKISKNAKGRDAVIVDAPQDVLVVYKAGHKETV